jgi:type II secretory pathway pseudopilin PulG
MKPVHGISLIEIAIAFVVVSIVVLVGLPAYQARVAREIVEEVLEVAAPARETIEEYVSLHGRLPATEGVALPFVTSKYVAATAWAASGASGRGTRAS